MSHCSVLVVTDGPDDHAEALEPYREQDENEASSDCFEWVDETEEDRDRYENEGVEMYWYDDGRNRSLRYSWDEAFRVRGSIGLGSDTHDTGDAIEVIVPYKVAYPTFEIYLKEYCGKELHEGKSGYWSNPNAKWDWWVVGGRYSARLAHVEGSNTAAGWGDEYPDRACDQVRRDELDIPRTEELMDERIARCWDRCHEKDRSDAEKQFVYGIEPGQTRDEYIHSESHVGFFAVLMNGKWHERGKLGWWGTVGGDKGEDDWSDEFEALFDRIRPDQYLTVVDIHI